MLKELEEEKADFLVSMHGDPELLDKMTDLEERKKFAERLRLKGVWKKGFKQLKGTSFQGTIETLWRKQVYRQAISHIEQTERSNAYDRSQGIHAPFEAPEIPSLVVKKPKAKANEAKDNEAKNNEKRKVEKPKPKRKTKRVKQTKIDSFFKK